MSSSTSWLGADIYIAPPDDANCSDEDSADDDNPHLHNLSGKQLMANCELQVTGYDDDNDVRVIHDTDGLAEIDEDEPSCPNPVTSLNNWKELSAEGEAQKELREKIENFEPQENIILQELDAENSSWTHLRTFELFFDDNLIELVVEITNHYALEKGAVAWTLADRRQLDLL